MGTDKLVKICHLSTVHKRYDVRIVLKECHTLSLKGYEVYFIVSDGIGPENFQGIFIHDIGKHSGRFTRVFFSPFKIVVKALEINAEIYHFHDAELLLPGLILRMFGNKVIYDVHDDLPKQILDKHYIPTFFRKCLSGLIRFIEKITVPFLSAVITADACKETRFRKYHRRVQAIYNYPLINEVCNIDLVLRKPNYLCYIGGITRIRGIMEILEAIEPLQVKLLLAGDFEPPELLAEAKSKPAWNSVEYYGFVDRNKVMNVLSEASIGLVILLPNENYLESLPIKMFEYMSASLPVIVSDFDHLRAIVDKYNCGVCVDPKDIAGISNAIRYLLDNPIIARSMGERGKKAIMEELNWNTQANSLIQLYRKVLTQ